MGQEKKVYKVLVGKPQRRRPVGKPRRRWEDGIRMNLRENGWGSVEWIQLAQDRDRWPTLVDMVMNLRVLEPGVTYLLSQLVSYLLSPPPPPPPPSSVEAENFLPATPFRTVQRSNLSPIQ
jgi:hypothetical protein